MILRLLGICIYFSLFGNVYPQQEYIRSETSEEKVERLEKIFLSRLNDFSCIDDCYFKEIGELKEKAAPLVKIFIKYIQYQKGGRTTYCKIAYALADIGEESAPAIPYLISYIMSQDNCMSMATLHALSGIGTPALNSIIELLYQQNTDLTSRSILILGQMQSKASMAVPHLIKFLHDSDERIRRTTIWALGEIGKATSCDTDNTSNEIIDALVNSLSDDAVLVRYDAIKALSNFDSTATFIVPLLIKSLKDEDFISNIAGRNLIKIGKKAIPILEEALKEKEFESIHEKIRWIISEIQEQYKNSDK